MFQWDLSGLQAGVLAFVAGFASIVQAFLDAIGGWLGG